jgi:3-methyladenine DNA glycosylase AlkD
MTPQQLYTEILEYCMEHASEENVIKYSRYFKGGVFNAWGLSTEAMNIKRNSLVKTGEINPDLIFETAPLLMNSGKYEETSFAISLLMTQMEKCDFKVFRQLEFWFSIGIQNWAHADYLGMFLLPAFTKKGFVKKEDLAGWIVSPFKFQRRCVPVTFIKLLKTNISFNALFLMLEPLMNDSEREVQQGMGWFLREAWKIKPEETEIFLMKWKNTAPRLIFQYACEKMEKESRLKFRKEK